MTETDLKPRKYKRLNETEGARARALWSTGAATLEEIAAETGVSSRALQDHFSRTGTTKGSAAATEALRIKDEVLTNEFGSRQERLVKGREARAASFNLAQRLESSLSTIAEMIATDPAQAFKFGAAIRSIGLALQAAERAHILKSEALGLTNVEEEKDLPMIYIRDLGEEDLEKIRRSHAAGEDDDSPYVDEEIEEQAA